MIKSIMSISIACLTVLCLTVTPAAASENNTQISALNSINQVLGFKNFPKTEETDVAPLKIVGRHTHRPPRVIRKRIRFTPNASPSVEQVRTIARSEQQRWGGPSLMNRMSCESGLNHAATNGQYLGLLQIGSWWSYAWPQTPRRVVLKKQSLIKKPVTRYLKWSNGKLTKKVLRKNKVRVIVKKFGRLPSNSSPFHGYAAIRVGQRAVSGDGPTTSWSCGL